MNGNIWPQCAVWMLKCQSKINHTWRTLHKKINGSPCLSLQSFTGLPSFMLLRNLLVTVDHHHDEPELQNHDQHVHHNLCDHRCQLTIGWETGTNNAALKKTDMHQEYDFVVVHRLCQTWRFSCFKFISVVVMTEHKKILREYLYTVYSTFLRRP